jgi:putative membrane protein
VRALRAAFPLAMTISDLPLLNACLNGASAVLLTIGYIQIKKQRQTAHRNCMIGAFATSTLFLASYLYYHYHARRTVFVDPAWFKPIYLTILLTHTILAVVIVPMIFTTLWRAYKKQWERHKAIARWTWPIWMYVSVTGVVIYLILYQIFPQAR